MRMCIFPHSLILVHCSSFRYIFAHIFLEVLILHILHIFEYTPYKVLITILDINMFSQSNVIPLILAPYVVSLSFVMISIA